LEGVFFAVLFAIAYPDACTAVEDNGAVEVNLKCPIVTVWTNDGANQTKL
jgi:hypothetical protein